jgi:hypothetical protein
MNHARAILYPLFSVLMLTAAGCAALGIVASAIPVTVYAQYAGLQGQTVGVLVWADRGILIDWDPIRLDLANAIQDGLLNRPKAEEMKGTTFPWKPASIVRYQRDHPATESLPITQVAPSLRVSRLVYVEVQQFSTRAERALELYKGIATISLKVIEVSPDGTARVGYTEDNIHVMFPKNAPQDGEPNLGDYKTYMGTVTALADEVVNRLTTHLEERGH